MQSIFHVDGPTDHNYESPVRRTDADGEPVKIASVSAFHEANRLVEKHRKDVFGELCEKHNLTPLALSMMPPHLIREMIMEIRPKIPAKNLPDDKVQMRVEEYYKDSLQVN